MTNARAFTDRLAALLREERAALVDFLLLLADFDRRRLFLELGHPNLFASLHRELGLSKGAAHYRKVAADLLLAKDAKKKGLVERPRAKVRPARPETMPAHVRREVWKRDGGRCQWPVESGGVCGSTLRLELDHVVPRARGGSSTVGNLRVLCAVHNQCAARQFFGDAWMDRYSRCGASGPGPVSPEP